MFLLLLAVYGLIGVLFAIAFVTVGYRRVDPSAANAGLIVRVMWMPAAVALWPLLILRWKKPLQD